MEGNQKRRDQWTITRRAAMPCPIAGTPADPAVLLRQQIWVLWWHRHPNVSSPGLADGLRLTFSNICDRPGPTF